MRPGVVPLTQRSPRVVAARKLTRRAERDKTGRFLAEGANAVEAALADGTVHELFVTDRAAAQHADLVDAARAAGVTVSHEDVKKRLRLAEQEPEKRRRGDGGD